MAVAGATRLLRAFPVFRRYRQRYRHALPNGTQTNIEELSHTGQRVCKWCFVPEGNLVAADVVLAQKIAETNERGALSVAHRSFVSM
jgi:hypothetical protein